MKTERKNCKKALNFLALLLNRLASWRSSGGGLLLALVSYAVKVDEKEEVGGKDGATEPSSAFATVAGTKVGKMRSVLVGVEGVGAAVDHNKINDELDDLHGCEILLPPDASAASSAEVVVVHEDVNSQIQSDGDPWLLKSREFNVNRDFLCVLWQHISLTQYLRQ